MKKVLIIDDETQVTMSLQRHLVRNKWRVISFNHPATALDYAKYGFYPVIISDYRMPEMNGVDFLVEYQKLQPYSFKIMLSGQADQYAMSDAINIANIDRFFHKPWDNELLIQQMEHGIEIFKNNIHADKLSKKQTLNESEFLKWNEQLLEKMSPGITKVRKNQMGWIETE